MNEENEPTEITRKDIDGVVEGWINNSEIRPSVCWKCGKDFFRNYSEFKCDECFFKQFPKEEVKKHCLSVLNDIFG